MESSFFLVKKGVLKMMPSLVSKKSITPLLEKHSLTPKKITQWSIHQGGISVLKAFKNNDSILSLSDEQIQPSKNLFQKYGN